VKVEALQASSTITSHGHALSSLFFSNPSIRITHHRNSLSFTPHLTGGFGKEQHKIKWLSPDGGGAEVSIVACPTSQAEHCFQGMWPLFLKGHDKAILACRTHTSRNSPPTRRVMETSKVDILRKRADGFALLSIGDSKCMNSHGRKTGQAGPS
jgi:hypothetical protein